MKIRPVGAKLFHADGRTDMKKLTVAFRNFANAPKNTHFFCLCVDWNCIKYDMKYRLNQSGYFYSVAAYGSSEEEPRIAAYGGKIRLD